MVAHQFNPSVLRTYDIRGIVDETLTTRDAYSVGRCFGTIVRDRGGKLVVVGRDGRLSSEAFKEALVRGLLESGIQVLNLGMVPTPVVYFAEHHLNADGGIMITGSHNPAHHNGFKMSLSKRPFCGNDILNFSRLASLGLFARGKGMERELDVEDPFTDKLLTDFKDHYAKGRPLKVAWDSGNGATGPLVKKLTDHLPGTHILLNMETDGTFPNHHPDPQDPQNLVQLQEVVHREGCDLGIAFDGDGDRLGVVDDRGHILHGDQVLLLFAEEVLRTKPGACIMADIKTSQLFFDEVKKWGGDPLIWCTGHSLIKKKMLEVNAALAGEASGHIFFKDRYYGFDDALYAALRMVGIVSLLSAPLSTWYDRFPKWYTTFEIKIPCSDTLKFQLIEKLKENIKKTPQEHIDLDGIRVIKQDGWWLLRASNTTACLIARLEAKTEDRLQELTQELREVLISLELTLPPFFQKTV